jgi:phospho-N-acetylmuramoyl-pentapeptide-transferase
MPTIPIRPYISLTEILIYSTLSFVIALIATPAFVSMLHRYKLGKQLRVQAVDGGSASVFLTYHQKKAGTPTMGGILIWGSIVITVFLSRIFSFRGFVDHSLLQRGQVYIPLAVLLSFGAIGAIDDYYNICGKGKNRGIDAMPKMLLFLLVSAIPAFWFYFRLQYESIALPFAQLLGFNSNIVHLGWLYIPFFMFVVIGTTNAVNVTDGLDGLAGGLLIIAFGSFGVISYITQLYVLSAFCGVVAGAIAAFLWFNVPPALFYMGDTGALALGGTLAVIAFMINQVLVLPLIGFIFVIEMLSVIIQLSSKRWLGRKVFRSAPIHHHFEALDWGESKVTMRFWIVGAFVAFLGVLVGIYG